MLVKKPGLVIDQYEVNLEGFDEIFLIGVGKAAYEQTNALFNYLSTASSISHLAINGFILTKKGEQQDPSCSLELHYAAHPIPEQSSVDATKRLLEVMQSRGAKTFFIFVLSGGASALLELPHPHFSLEDIQAISRELIRGGADIHEINAIRKELSLVKNGGLLKSVKASDLMILATSDIFSGEISYLGSGPLHFKKTNEQKLINLAQKYLSKMLRNKFFDFLHSKQRKQLQLENQKTKKAKQVFTHVLLTPQAFVKTAAETLKQLSFATFIYDAFKGGDIEEGVKGHIEYLKHVLPAHQGTPFAIVSGGEYTVKVSGNGIGGRNTHFVLLMAKQIFELNVLNQTTTELEKIWICSIGSDGDDGNSGHAGSYLDYKQYQLAKKTGHNLNDYIGRFDSCCYFKSIDCLIKLGPTGTNVCDLRMILFN